MYKIKLFRNMSGLVTGQSLKQMIINKDWWKGMLGNMFSTMMGIILTVGVAALVEYHNDKKLAREMMFNIVNTADHNVKILEQYDSLYNIKVEAITKIVDVYERYGKDLNKAPEDTLKKLQPSMEIMLKIRLITGYLQPSEYFNSAQMMHQFGNADTYATFAEFVRLNKETFATIDDLNKQSLRIFRLIARCGNFDVKPVCEKFNQLIEDGELSDFIANIKLGAHLPMIIDSYKIDHKVMLKMMDATEDDFKEYQESNKAKDVEMKIDRNYKKL